MKKIDLTGQVFGRLTVYGPAKKAGTKTQWACICKCGVQAIVRSELLRSGRTQSCGCLRSEILSIIKTKHGKSHSPEWVAYCGMMARCGNHKHDHFQYYGGRGIKVCARWQESFSNFYADMGSRPDGYSIDRMDVNGDYEPSNCEWIPAEKQAQNKRNNHKITKDGKTFVIAQWARFLGIPASTISHRLKMGLQPVDALRAAK